MKNVLFCLVSGFIIFASCKSSKTAANAETAANSTLQETYWRLTELRGKPTGPTPEGKREVHIKFRKEGNNLEGFAGCNGIGGIYELKEGNRIHISNVVGTMIACEELEAENALLEVLKTADNYNLNGKQLVLNKARMAPLARFEAVYLK